MGLCLKFLALCMKFYNMRAIVEAWFLKNLGVVFEKGGGCESFVLAAMVECRAFGCSGFGYCCV